MSRKTVTASAPGKVILFGEHFVVYGEPAIVLAIDKRAYTSAELRRDKRIHINSLNLRAAGTFSGHKYQAEKGGSQSRAKLEPVKNAVQQILQAVESKAGISVTIKSDIPVSAGLGSSAAVATSTIMAVGALLEKELSREQIFRLAYESERLVHGTPSGIDPAIATYGGAVRFQKNKDLETLEVPTSIPLVIGNTHVERSTGGLVATVKQIRDSYPIVIDPIIKIGGRVAELAVESLKNGSLESVGELMNINHALLCAVGVSHESLESLIFAARKGGALGAKLTGGGGGGCMIALAEDKKLKKVTMSIQKAGGKAFEANKTDEGVRVEP